MVEKLDSESVVSKNPWKLKERERKRATDKETLANAMRCKSKLFFFYFFYNSNKKLNFLAFF